MDGRESLEYLLLGDLRQLLEDPPGLETDRWLLAVLDMLLTMRPHPAGAPLEAAIDRLAPVEERPGLRRERSVLYSKLQRLRDRVAHRAPFALIANELRCDLRELIAA